MRLASNFDTIESWIEIVGHRDIYYGKKLYYFLCVEFRILVEKLNVYESHIIQMSLYSYTN